MYKLNRPTIEQLNTVLEQLVIVRVQDDDILGILYKSTDDVFQRIPEIYSKPQHYCLLHPITKQASTLIFRCSHVKYIEIYQTITDIPKQTILDLTRKYY